MVIQRVGFLLGFCFIFPHCLRNDDTPAFTLEILPFLRLFDWIGLDWIDLECMHRHVVSCIEEQENGNHGRLGMAGQGIMQDWISSGICRSSLLIAVCIFG